MRKKIWATLIGLVLLVPIGIGGVGYMAAYKALHLPRQETLKTPADYGLEYENIAFESTDQIPLKGWWIPGEGDAVVFVIHGYGANKAGWQGRNINGEEEYIDWLASAGALNEAGFNLVYFDLRASGESGGDTITLGRDEVQDLMGAVNWVLDNQQKADGSAIDAIGFLGMSMGGNVALRGAVALHDLPVERAAVISVGAYRFDTMLGKSIRFWTNLPDFFVPVVAKMSGLILGFDPSAEIDPVNYVAQISPTPVMFIQAEKDEIGDLADANAFFAASQEPKQLIVLPDALRFEAYRYPAEHSETVVSFFSRYLLND